MTECFDGFLLLPKEIWTTHIISALKNRHDALFCLSRVCKWQYKTVSPKNHLALKSAAGSGSLKVMKMLMLEGCPLDRLTIDAALGEGRLDVLKWLKARGFRFSRPTYCTSAAEGGHLGTLQWLVEIGCSCNGAASLFAAGKGQLHVIKWIKEVGVAAKSVVRQFCCQERTPTHLRMDEGEQAYFQPYNSLLCGRWWTCGSIGVVGDE